MGKLGRIGQDAIDDMRMMRAAGISARQIARKLGYSESVVSKYTTDVAGMSKWAKQSSRKEPAQEEAGRPCEAAGIGRTQAPGCWEIRELYPCEHCRWRKDLEAVPVCFCYRQRWSAGAAREQIRFSAAEIRHAAKRLETTLEDAERILKLWDNGRSADAVVDAYREAMGW